MLLLLLFLWLKDAQECHTSIWAEETQLAYFVFRKAFEKHRHYRTSGMRNVMKTEWTCNLPLQRHLITSTFPHWVKCIWSWTTVSFLCLPRTPFSKFKRVHSNFKSPVSKSPPQSVIHINSDTILSIGIIAVCFVPHSFKYLRVLKLVLQRRWQSSKGEESSWTQR